MIQDNKGQPDFGAIAKKLADNYEALCVAVHGDVDLANAKSRGFASAAENNFLPLIHAALQWMEDAEHHLDCEAFNGIRTTSSYQPPKKLTCTCGLSALLAELPEPFQPEQK